MNSIIEQIQKEAAGQDVPVSTLLRKVKLAAAKLNQKSVEDWVDKELKGYGRDDDVPQYRKVRGKPMAKDNYWGWQPIVGPPKFVEAVSVVPMGQSIAGLESLLAERKDGQLIFHYEPGLLQQLREENGHPLVECGAFLDRATAVGVVDAVRTLILEWAIDMEKTGVKGTDVNFSDQEQKIAAGAPVSIHIGSIHGFTGSLGVGNVARDVTSTTLQIDRVGELVNQIKSNVSALAREGLDEHDLMPRVAKIEAELNKPTPDHGVIANLLTGIRSAVSLEPFLCRRGTHEGAFKIMPVKTDQRTPAASPK